MKVWHALAPSNLPRRLGQAIPSWTTGCVFQNLYSLRIASSTLWAALLGAGCTVIFFSDCRDDRAVSASLPLPINWKTDIANLLYRLESFWILKSWIRSIRPALLLTIVTDHSFVKLHPSICGQTYFFLLEFASCLSDMM
jgi:hypothetical protein